MEEQFKKDDKILSELISEAGLDSPSLSFDDNVMRAIKEAEAKSIAYKPLIPKKIWVFITIGFAALLAVLIFSGPGEPGIIKNLVGDTGFSIPEFSVSRIFIYAIAFLGLFLVQIPILKRQLIDRTY